MERKALFLALTLCAACGCTSLNAQGYGQVPGPHPAYLHALSDLRAARRDRALREVDAAHDTVDKAVRIARWQ